MNHELPDVQAEFWKGRGTRDHICQHLLDHQKSKSKRVPEKKSTSALLTMPKPLIVWIKTNSGKFFKRWEYQTTLPASREIGMQVNKWQELDKEQQTGSKLGKGYIKAVYCHSAYLTYKQWLRAFIGSWGGQHPETAQSSVTVIFKLVISGLPSIILVVLGQLVNIEFRGALVPVFWGSVLGIVAAQVL